MRRVLLRLFLSLSVGIAVAASPALRGQDAPPAPADESADREYQGDPQWPRVIEDGDTTFTIYQPQIDKFDSTELEARAAVQVETKVGDKTQTTYGVIWITAHTEIDKENRLVQLDDIQVAKANFPTCRAIRPTSTSTCFDAIRRGRARSPSRGSKRTSPSRRPTRRARPSR